MSLKLNLRSDLLSEEDVQQLTNEVCQTINYETDSEAELSTKEAAAGSKAVDPAIIGEIILTALSSGAVGSLFGVLKSYISRDSTLSIEITGTDGKSVKINAKNISSEELNNTISQLESIL